MSQISFEIQKDYLVELRRDFHRHPELAAQERRTAEVIERELDRAGVSHVRVGATGVLGVLRGEQPGNGVVALRADIDALPLQERGEVEYRSLTDGVMHACGHDAHTACLLGAAKALSERRDSFGGEIRFFFQPGEETGQGAPDFLAEGAMDGVERVFGLHCAPELPTGAIAIKAGLNNASVDQFRILIHGKAAHVSTPQLGADALYAASQTVVALQGLVTRRTSPVEPVLIGVGRLRAGSTYNAVAEEAELEGTIRTISQETRTQVREWVDQTVERIAAISGTQAEIIWTEFASALINDAQACREAVEAARDLGPAVRVIEDRPLSLCGDNFAEYLRRAPGCYAFLGTGDPERPSTQNPLHNNCFDLDEDALVLGAELYAAYAIRWLTGKA